MEPHNFRLYNFQRMHSIILLLVAFGEPPAD